MQGDKQTFIKDKTFYKEFTQNEFMLLKILHDGVTNLKIDFEMVDNKQYITMPADHIISTDTIAKNRRSNLTHIIIENIPFILKQIQYLTVLQINYSDNLQFLYHDNKMYLIDMDISHFDYDSYNQYNNYHLLYCFLSAFNIDHNMISDCIHYLQLFQNGCTLEDAKQTIYDKLNRPEMQKNHVYYCRNQRYIQADVKNIQLLTDNANVFITETILNPDIIDEWELIRVY